MSNFAKIYLRATAISKYFYKSESGGLRIIFITLARVKLLTFVSCSSADFTSVEPGGVWVNSTLPAPETSLRPQVKVSR